MCHTQLRHTTPCGQK
ncbi:hypothetical protein F383_26639 [Gossypium arboreum]|uniref:Uncharacterized protein n=1 Tax=Gossypium arboreum TaxID=29729 RepID=A0A0B0NIK3_GOSAR|nr:hypothetical protein F383_18760 [Gossypium arboreum]KHG21466.1 hypothetical protein F383_26639 [Gossypium arboreum]